MLLVTFADTSSVVSAYGHTHPHTHSARTHTRVCMHTCIHTYIRQLYRRVAIIHGWCLPGLSDSYEVSIDAELMLYIAYRGKLMAFRKASFSCRQCNPIIHCTKNDLFFAFVCIIYVRQHKLHITSSFISSCCATE